MRVCLLLPYFGPLPKWLPLFLRSVELNPSLDLFLITNETIPCALPTNVKHVALSLVDIERRVRQVLSPGFRFSWAYKLCDLKPFYALVFDELIQEYSFWGYCDLDLVFGQVGPLVTAERLASTDFFSADAGLIVGHFALYRNHPAINALGKRIPSFQTHLNSPDSFQLDEKGMTEVLDATPEVRRDRPRELSESQLSISSEGRMVGRTSGVLGVRHRFYWQEGKAYVHGRGHPQQEVLYLHFMGLKRAYHWTKYDAAVEYAAFGLSGGGFQPWVVPPTIWARSRWAVRSEMLRQLSRIRTVAAKNMPNSWRRQVKGLLTKLARWRREGCSPYGGPRGKGAQ